MADSQTPSPTPGGSPSGEDYMVASQSRRTDAGKFSEEELRAMVADVPRSVSETRARVTAEESRRGAFWALWGCNLIVFASSVCIMVVELCASRLIASYLGSSLYTWTSVIGVVLAGISLGNYVGGWIAERFDPRRSLGWQFMLSGLLTASILFTNQYASTLNQARPDTMAWQAWVMLLVALVFLPPSIALGTISPVTASLALRRTQRTGVTVGNIYAWGALGSIVGTFLAGFWLMDELGTRHIIWITACVLLLLGAIVSGSQRALRVFLLFGAIQFVLLLGILSAVTAGQCEAMTRSAMKAVTGWNTESSAFADDALREQEALQVGDERTADRARQRLLLRADWKNSEDAWGNWAHGLGRRLHDVGLQLNLRRDQLDEYLDESDYYAVNIYPARQDGEMVKVLRLDYLIHSYYNPAAPNRLHYDYEEVYAALTERAAETWNRQVSIPVEGELGERLTAISLPSRLKYDSPSQRMVSQGALRADEALDLLSAVADAPLWQAIAGPWREMSKNWRENTQFTQGELVVPWSPSSDTADFLREVPEGKIASGVRYDARMGGLVFSEPFSMSSAFDALIVGGHANEIRLVRDLYQRSRQTSALFIGGGGFIFPRWLEHEFPWYPRIDVAEIDPAVLKGVQLELGLSRKHGPPADGGTWIQTTIGDARLFVDEQVRRNMSLGPEKAVTYDFVYGDAFNDLSVPWHLTTREFSEQVKELLTPNEGVYLVNIIDVYPRSKIPGRKARSLGLDLPGIQPPFPEDWFPEIVSNDRWYPGRKRPLLQIRRRDENRYNLGFRGVMDDSTLNVLLEEAKGNSSLQANLRGLQRLTQADPLGQFLGRYLQTVRNVFPYVYVFTSDDHRGEPDERRDTFIVACSLKKLDCSSLYDSGHHWHNEPFATSERDPATGSVVDSGHMTALLQISRGIELTDDFSPVDNLLAPVFASRNEEED
ncbi:MAG TPA: hypothetical protein DDY91_05980 [Planctomycetaceae bacterium]|nr:hypothetical protein [Planctomycetaceae bacterium]